MRKVNYKGRCTKRKLSKCKEVCRTYDEIQMKVADMLQATDDIKAFRCNVCLEGVLVVDEIQNVVNSKNGSIVVGMLTQLINNAGISMYGRDAQECFVLWPGNDAGKTFTWPVIWTICL